MTWILLGVAVACEVTATLALKGAMSVPWLYAVVAAGYAASFVLLALVLRRGMGLGVAYGVWGALGVLLTATLSSLVFHEPFTGLMGIGVALVVAGVLTVEIASQRAHAPSIDREG